MYLGMEDEQQNIYQEIIEKDMQRGGRTQLAFTF